MKRLAFAFLFLFVFVVPVESYFYLEGIGSISRIIGIVALLLTLFLVLFNRKIRRVPSDVFLLYIYATIGALSYVWSFYSAGTIQWIQTTLQMLSLFWLIFELSRNDKNLNNIFFAFVCGSLVASFGVFYSYSTEKTLYLIDGRYVPFGFDPNELGITLAIAIIVSAYLLNELTISKKFKLFLWCYIFVGSIAILLTASRSAFICLIISILFILLNNFKISPWKNIIILLTLFFLLPRIVEFLPTLTFERIISTYESVAYGGLNNRISIWMFGFQVFFKEPFLGVGAGAFPVAVQPLFGRLAVTHNTFLSVLFELGLVGFFFFCSFLVVIFRRVIKFGGDRRFFLIMFLLCWAVGAMSLTWENSKVTWLVLSLAFSSTHLQPKYLRIK